VSLLADSVQRDSADFLQQDGNAWLKCGHVGRGIRRIEVWLEPRAMDSLVLVGVFQGQASSQAAKATLMPIPFPW
jgi:hypothetical protein